MAKIAQNSKKAFKQVDTEIDHTIKKMKELANSFDTVDKKTSSTGAGIGRWIKGLGIGTAIAGVVGVAAISGLIKDSIGKSIQYEKTTKSYEVLTGNAGIGKAIAGDLNKLQQDTILGPEVFKSGQTLLGFGLAADKVIPTIKMLGDVSQGDADKFSALTLAFAQMTSAGRLQGQDLLQMVNAGFNPLNIMAKQTGKSMFELRKEMEKGNISSEMTTKAFQAATEKGGLFNNMMNKMGETTGGKIAQLQGGFEALKIAIGDKMKPAVGAFVSGLSSVVSKVKTWFEIPIQRKLSDEIITIKTLTAQLSSANITHERQLELLNQLEQINPKILEGIDKQAVSYSKLRENVERVTNALRDNIKLEVMKDKITPTIMKYEGAMKSREATIFDTMKAVTENFPSIANATNLSDEQKITTALVKARELEAAWYSANEDKRGNTRTPFTALITKLNGQDSNISYLTKTINELEPEYNKGMKDIADQKATVDKVLGIGSMVTAAGINGSGKSSAGTKEEKKDSVASSITGGGPRVININGVKFMDKLELHTATFGEGADEIEKVLHDMFNRLLNSGASVQS